MKWPTIRLGSVCRVVPGFAFKSQDWTTVGIPVVKIKNIREDNTVDLSTTDHVPDDILTPRLSKFVLKDNDILLAMTGATAGKVGRVRTNRPVLLNQRVAKIVPDTADPRFIWSVVSSHRYQELFFRLADGAAQPNMSGGQIEGLEIPNPPIEVQRRIGALLASYDDLIENNTRRIAILEEMARRIYEEWFVRFRFPGHEGVRMVESVLGLVPDGWPVVPFVEVCAHLTRGVTPKYREGSGRFILNQKANRGFELVETEFKELSEECAVPPEKFARFGDVLVNSLGEGTIGRVHFYSGESRDIAVDQHMTICRAANPGLGRLIYQYLESPAGQERIQSVKTGATSMTMLNISALRQFPIARPPTAVLSAFWGACEPIVQLSAKLRRKNAILRTTRDLLLPKLISGELEVSAIPEPEALAA